MRYILLLINGLLLTGCALLEPQPWQLASPPGGDSTRTVIVAKNYYGGTYKDRSDRRAAEGGTFVAKAGGPVATGTSQAQDFTQAGQRGGAVATAPGATSDATTRTGVPPWVLVVGGIVVVLLALLGLAYRCRGKLAGLLLKG